MVSTVLERLRKVPRAGRKSKDAPGLVGYVQANGVAPTYRAPPQSVHLLTDGKTGG